jgi:hypothetical protein
MLSTLLSLLFPSLVLALILLLLAGAVAALELYNDISPNFVTSVSWRVATGLYRFVVLAVIVCCVIAILHLLTGGGINAL